MSLRTRWTLALVAGSAALFLAAACGSDGGSGDSSGEGQGGASAYLACLRDQGIDVPDTLPSGRPSGFPSGMPSGFPSGRPTAFPSDRPSGAPGGGRMGGFRPEGVDDATWQKAQEACASVRPTGGPAGGPGGGPGGGADREAGAAYRNCLADRGVDIAADPSTTDPKVAAALEACAVLRPTATPTP